MERSEKQEDDLSDAVERMIPITAHPQFELNVLWQTVRTRSHVDTDAGYESQQSSRETMSERAAASAS